MISRVNAGDRRALDMEGWSNDVGLLRKQLAAAERKMKEMKLIERLPGAVHRPYVGHSSDYVVSISYHSEKVSLCLV